MFTPSYKKLKEIVESKGYTFFTKPGSINIIGIRTSESTNEFNDTMCLAWIDEKMTEKIEYFPCTTKAGRFYLLAPLTAAGTAILKEGQYKAAYKVGLHKGYEAMEQINPMSYFRDNNKDAKPDYVGTIVQGNFKTNIHRAAESGWSKFVDNWSAGCQVITGVENGKTEFNIFMSIVKASAEKYGNSFTYTLVNRNDFQ